MKEERITDFVLRNESIGIRQVSIILVLPVTITSEEEAVYPNERWPVRADLVIGGAGSYLVEEERSPVGVEFIVVNDLIPSFWESLEGCEDSALIRDTLDQFAPIITLLFAFVFRSVKEVTAFVNVGIPLDFGLVGLGTQPGVK